MAAMPRCATPTAASAVACRSRLAQPAPLRIEPAALTAARDALPSDLRDALLHMARNIEAFHLIQVPPSEQWADVSPGIRVGRVWRALDRVAAYVPGGEAAYPSSLLMSAIPARLAGVRELVVASPAGRDGRVSTALLGAAGLMGVAEFYVMGGAQAIAALAYGDGVGPARRSDRRPGQRLGHGRQAGGPRGDLASTCRPAPPRSWSWPTRRADPAHVAADLLSQAEHGADSPALLVTTSGALADAVESEVERQLDDARSPSLPRGIPRRGRPHRRGRRPRRGPSTS